MNLLPSLITLTISLTTFALPTEEGTETASQKSEYQILRDRLDDWMIPMLKSYSLRGSPGCENLVIYGVSPSPVYSGFFPSSSGHFGVALHDRNGEKLKQFTIFNRDELEKVKTITESELTGNKAGTGLLSGKSYRSAFKIVKDVNGELKSITVSYKESPFFIIDYGFSCYR